MSQSSPPAAAPKPAGGGIILGLVPWVLFTLIAKHGTLTVASIAAVVIAAGVCMYSARDGGRPKLIELAAVATFIVFTVISLIADPSVTHWLTRYARAVSPGVLALLVFASLLAVPFTEEYARQSVPRAIWSSPGFKEINRRLTVMWGGVFAVMTVSHVIAGAVNEPRTNIIFNWAIPIALILWAAKRSAAEGAAESAHQQA